MKRPEQIRILHELLRQLDQDEDADAGCILENPTDAYTSPKRASQEWELFFRQHPQLIGLSGDLRNVGDFSCIEEFGVPILAVRDESGQFRAFINACRHRGARLTQQASGNAKRFVCPFHGWTYANSGQLTAISEAKHFGLVDRSCLGLIELPAEERYGLLWVHPDVNGELDIDMMLGGLAPELEAWHLSDRILSGTNALDKEMNWKLANDTFGENYHFKRLHRNTLNHLAIGDAHVFQAFARNSRLVFASRGIDALLHKPEAQWRIDKVTTVLYYLFPNIQMTVSERQVTLFRIYPAGKEPGRCAVRVSHYFSEEALRLITDGKKTVIDDSNVYDSSARDGNAIIAPAAAMEVINSTLEHEDFLMAEMTQKTAASGALENILFGRNEPALHHFHNTFREALGMPSLHALA